MNRFLLLLFVLFGSLAAQAQIKWLTWDQAMQAYAREPKKMVIDVYTDWCGWCKRMDQTTFADSGVGRLVNEDFYAVKLNAEHQGPLSFNGKTYQFENDGKRGVHGLAKHLLRGRMGYPTVVFLNKKAEIIQAIPGYMPADEFKRVLRYFGDDVYLDTPWKDYSDKSSQDQFNAKNGGGK